MFQQAFELPAYAELHALSNYSFQRGASHPEELVERALALGYSALAITDECSLAGVVRAHIEAKKLDFKLLIGAEFAVRLADQDSEPAFKIIVLACSREGYGDLSQFITDCRARAVKGDYLALASDFFASGERPALNAEPASRADPTPLVQHALDTGLRRCESCREGGASRPDRAARSGRRGHRGRVPPPAGESNRPGHRLRKSGGPGARCSPSARDRSYPAG